jgi:hypothetical protein
LIGGADELAGVEPPAPPLLFPPPLPQAVAPIATATATAAHANHPGLCKPFTSPPLVALR